MELNLYLVRNLFNGAMYVGKTIRTIKQRWAQHLSDARHEISNSHLHRAIRKYGVENFVIDPLVLTEESADEKSLNDAERLMIRLLRIYCKLYNLTDGGEGASGRKLSEDHRRKLVKANRGKPSPRRGTHLPEEHRRRIGESNKGKLAGRKLTDEHRRKIGAGNKGKGVARIGIVHSEGHRLAQSRALKDKPWTALRRAAYEVRKGEPFKTHCVHGHERSPDSVDRYGRCLKCRELYNLNRRKQAAARIAELFS